VLNINDDVGVRINKTFRSFVFAAGGHENLNFGERDVRNYVAQSRRALGKEGDGKTLLNYFFRMRELNPQFISTLIWAMITAYDMYFGFMLEAG